MTLLGIAQILIYFAILLAITKPVGVFMYRVFEGERTFLHPIFRPLERLIYWLGGVREDEEHSWVRYSACYDLAECLQLPVCVCAAAVAGASPAEPDALFDAPGSPVRHADDAGPGVQHSGQLHDEHELAVLFPGHHGQLLHTDGSSRRPEFCLRRSGYRCCRCDDSRVCAPHCEDDRKFLGRRNPLHALHPASDLYCHDSAFRLAGIHPKLQTACHRPDSGRSFSNDRARTLGVAVIHQDAGNQWRRILQCELGPPVRESNASVEPASNDSDLFAGAGLTYMFGKMVRDHPPGLGNLCSDVRNVSAPALSSAIGPSSAEIRC